MIIDRHRSRPVTEAEETQLREEIEEFVHPTSSGSGRFLHVPDGNTNEPICQYTRGGSWRRSPTTAWPPGHRRLCCHCVREYFEENSGEN